MTTTPTPNPIETHDTHSKRLIEHAQEQLEKGDRLQASEKAWGAVAHKAKVIADRMGWTYDTHTDFHGLKNRIAKLTDDPKTTRRLLSIALHLHTNYYRDQYPLEDIRADLEEVKTLLDILDGPEFMQPVERKPRNSRPPNLGGPLQALSLPRTPIRGDRGIKGVRVPYPPARGCRYGRRCPPRSSPSPPACSRPEWSR